MSEHTRSIDDWFRDTPAGDVVLCDPFNGESWVGDDISNPPTNPPKLFVNDPKLSNGYGYWRGSQYHDAPPKVGVWLADPTHPDGLGDFAEFAELACDFDVVAYSGL